MKKGIVAFRIDPGTKECFRELAYVRRTTMSDIARALVVEEIESSPEVADFRENSESNGDQNTEANA